MKKFFQITRTEPSCCINCNESDGRYCQRLGMEIDDDAIAREEKMPDCPLNRSRVLHDWWQG